MKDLDKSEVSINFTGFLKIIQQNIVSIVLWGIGGLILALLVSFLFLTPKYSSSIDLLVNQKTQDVSAQYNAQQADLQAISTYKDVLGKSIVLSPVYTELQKKDNYNGSMSEFSNSISVGNETNSQVLTITATDQNPYVAKDMVNILGDVFTKKIKKMMKVNNVTILSKGVANNSPVFPNKKLNSLIGLLIGLLLGLLIAVIQTVRDTTVKDIDYLTNELGLTNLGTVYHIRNQQKAYKVVHVQADNVGHEKQYKRKRV